MDFVLWKPSKEGEPAWPSPAGIKAAGRPGWHIECSAMSWRHLGETFDIHGGGIDLLFPHHENEIAQSRSAFHMPLMARTWMHNGFLQVEGSKMAKSAGNFVTIRELLSDWPGEVLRLNMLRTHYRQPIDWTEAGMAEAERTLDQWYGLTSNLSPGTPSAGMLEALCDDLNTPRALAVLHELRQEAVKGDQEAAASLKASAQMIGLLQMSPADWAARRRTSVTVDDAQIERLVDARNAARKARNFAEADRIRDELAAMGVELEDHKDGTTTWKVKR
jgi:cysteinyl-tRNA synthetase